MVWLCLSTKQCFYLLIFYTMLFDIFVMFIFSNTSLNMEESEARANIICESLYWRTDMSGKDTVQELCWKTWSEVYGYEKK